MKPEDDLEFNLADLNVELITPRWQRPDPAFPGFHIGDPIALVERQGEDWVLSLLIDGEPYTVPVREGQPDGDLVEVAPGVRSWGEMKTYGLERLGPGVWKVTPSLWVPGELHAFIVLRDVPEPAPFSKPILFSPEGTAL